MANEDVLGPRKTMFVLVIVVGCFAVLWPRILSPLILGNTRDQLKPNQYDREAGCCEVVFEPEVAVLELVKELCSTAVGTDGRLSALAAAQCRKSVNETCGVDIIEFLKRTDNVGKSTKKLLEIMKIGNSSCLRENFGVPVWSFSEHSAWNTGAQSDTLKQERPPIRGAGPHPALRERGRAIPAGAPTPPSRVPVQLPPHVRPPPIPGMRPPLGSPGGPVPAPKSSMGFVMPIYTICIIVFFVYTLSKILFKRTGSSPYEPISPDPQFRRRVFRDDSRTTPDTKLVVTAISGLVAEVQQQMEANYAQSQQRQEAQENHTRPYTNGMVNTNPPVQIIATEYREPTKEKSPQPEKVKEPSPEPKEITSELMEATPEPEESTPETKEPSPESKELSPESNEPSLISKEFSPEPEEPTPEPKESTPEPKEPTPEPKESTPEPKEPTPESKELSRVSNEPTPISKELSPEPKEPTPEPKEPTPKSKETTPEPKEPSREITPEPDDFDDELIRITENIAKKEIDKLTKASEDLINEARGDLRVVSTLDLEMESDRERRSTSELLEEALKEDSSKSTEENDTEDGDQENGSVKVVGMEVTAHSADGGAWPVAAPRPRTPAAPAPKAHEAQEVKSIYLETEIPQQSRVLVTDFVEDTAEKPFKPTKKHSPLVVSGKMTLSLIQDAPRDTPERDTVSESTMDEFTTASAVTQPAAEKQDDLSEEEIEEEIEIEEIEEEVEEEEEEPQETVEVRKKVNKVAGDD